MREREEREKQSDRKQVGRVMFIRLHAKQREGEKCGDRERGGRACE